MAIQNMLGGATAPLNFALGGTVGLPGCYVSQSIGSDVTGNGSQAKPYASIGAAITALGNPVVNTTIYIMDSETYAENVVINTTNINICGPESILSPGAGSAFVLGTNASVVLQFKAIVGNISITTNGNLFIECWDIFGDMASNDGNINLRVSTFGGTLSTASGLIFGFMGKNAFGGPHTGNIEVMTGTGALP